MLDIFTNFSGMSHDYNAGIKIECFVGLLLLGLQSFCNYNVLGLQLIKNTTILKVEVYKEEPREEIFINIW